jgi:hypothetical protein
MVPYRVGIEFECFGAVGSYLIKDKKKPSNKEIRDKLGIYDFSEDEHWHNPNDETSDVNLNEVRVSFLGYKQLIHFYKTIMILNKCLIIPAEKGGIHIHIDAPFVKEHSHKVVEWFDKNTIQSQILRIFEGYKGTYNSKGAGTSKGHYVRVAITYNTIEFRIGHLTFDYDTIIRWVIECSKLVRQCMTELGAKPVVMAKTKKPKLSAQDDIRTYQFSVGTLSDAGQAITAISNHNEELRERVDRLAQENEAMRRYILREATYSASNRSSGYWTTYNADSYNSPF